MCFRQIFFAFCLSDREFIIISEIILIKNCLARHMPGATRAVFLRKNIQLNV